MEPSFIFFSIVFIKIGITFSENSVSLSFLSDNEIESLNLNENLILQPEEWEFLWLTQAFISYLKSSTNKVFFDFSLEKEFVINRLQPALIHEGMSSLKLIPKFINMTELYSSMKIQEDINSFKGSCIVRMLSLSLGNYIFKQGLIDISQTSESKTMKLDCFWHSFQYRINKNHKKLPVDIKTIMNLWMKQDGYPVVHVEIIKNIAKLSQKKYLINNSTEYHDNYLWYIPLTWTSSSEMNFLSTIPKYWLYKDEDQIQLQIKEDEWVIFNVQHAGFYRVNYDEASWHRIIYALHFHPLDNISVINRAAIISDSFNLAKAGIIPFEIALNSVTYITRETDSLPIMTALTELTFLFKYFDGLNSNELFNKFWLALIKPSYDRLSQHDRVNDRTSRKIYEQLTKWVCILGYEKCIKNVLHNFERWKSHFKLPLTKTEEKLMLCIAVKHNSTLLENGAIETIVNYYLKSSDLSNRAIAISSLACITDYKVLKIILEMLLTSHSKNNMQKQEIIYLLKLIIEKSYKDAQFICEFILEHYDIILEYYGNNNIFIEILKSLSEILDIQIDSTQYYDQINNYNQLSEAINNIFERNVHHNNLYCNYYENIIKWIEDNRHFILLEVERETKNNNEHLEIIENFFQNLQSFYQEYSFSNKPSTLISVQNFPLNASYFFWKRVFNDWTYLKNKIYFDDQQSILNYHMLQIVSPIFDKLGFDEKPSDTYGDKALRSDVIDWACRLEHADCILKSFNLFKNWKLSRHLPIPMNIQKTVLCIAIKYKFSSIYYFLRILVQSKQSNRELAIEYGLGCVNEISIDQVLPIILDLNNNLALEYRLRIISSICLVGDFKLAEILMYLCSNSDQQFINTKNFAQFYRILEAVSPYFSTIRDIKLFEACLDLYPNTSRMVFSLKSVADQAVEKLDLIDYHKRNFSNWLKTTYTSFDYQLPKNLKPIKYEIYIVPNESFFYGSVLITLNVLHDSDRIILFATDLIIDQITVINLNTDQVVDVLFFLQDIGGRCKIYLNSLITNGTVLLVTIAYSGTINYDLYGVYRVPFYNNDEEPDWLITTQFQMSHARRAFPCFDEPSFKATFIIHICRRNDYKTFSNMEISRSTPSTGRKGWTWDVYEESELMSTYLVAFIICKHEIFEYNGDMTYWSNHDLNICTSNVLKIAHDAVKILSVYTGISFPMKKVDFVEIPGFSYLGMENWGVIVLDDKLVSLSSMTLHKNILNTITFTEFVVVHEIVHTWFGNLVTCDTWKYFWLNEGFTRYFEWRVMNSIQPQLKWMEKFIVYVQHVAFTMDSESFNLPLSNEKMNLIRLEGNNNEYDNTALIYSKAPCIIRMMNHAFGDGVFNTAIKYYLKKNMWGTSTPSKLWSAVDKTLRVKGRQIQGSHESIAIMMESWTSQPGYPILHVHRTHDRLIFKQERFVFQRTNRPVEIYWIPITYTTKSNPDFKNTLSLFWMGTSMSYENLTTSDDEWVIVNINQVGFYRVNYDINTWNNIFKALNEDNFGGIPEINRAQILDDLFNLARADYISYKLAFTGAQYLRKERGYLPWKVFFNVMENIYGKFDDPTVCESLRNYIAELIKPYYHEIRTYTNINDEHENDLNIPLIITWACKIDLGDWVTKALSQFKKWSKNPDMPITETNIRLCTALQHSSYSDWKLLQNRYFVSNCKFEKNTILNSLGCSRNVTTLTEYIRFLVFNDSKLNEQEIKTAFSSIFNVEQLSIDAILNFFIIYHKEIDYQNLWNKVHILRVAISRNVYTSHQIKQLVKLIKALEHNNDNVKRELQSDLSQIEIRKQWFDDHKLKILRSL